MKALQTCETTEILIYISCHIGQHFYILEEGSKMKIIDFSIIFLNEVII